MIHAHDSFTPLLAGSIWDVAHRASAIRHGSAPLVNAVPSLPDNLPVLGTPGSDYLNRLAPPHEVDTRIQSYLTRLPDNFRIDDGWKWFALLAAKAIRSPHRVADRDLVYLTIYGHVLTLYAPTAIAHLPPQYQSLLELFLRLFWEACLRTYAYPDFERSVRSTILLLHQAPIGPWTLALGFDALDALYDYDIEEDNRQNAINPSQRHKIIQERRESLRVLADALECAREASIEAEKHGAIVPWNPHLRHLLELGMRHRRLSLETDAAREQGPRIRHPIAEREWTTLAQDYRLAGDSFNGLFCEFEAIRRLLKVAERHVRLRIPLVHRALKKLNDSWPDFLGQDVFSKLPWKAHMLRVWLLELAGSGDDAFRASAEAVKYLSAAPVLGSPQWLQRNNFLADKHAILATHARLIASRPPGVQRAEMDALLLSQAKLLNYPYVSLREIQARLPHGSVCVIYLLGRAGGAMLLVSSSELHMRPLSIDSHQVARILHQLHDLNQQIVDALNAVPPRAVSRHVPLNMDNALRHLSRALAWPSATRFADRLGAQTIWTCANSLGGHIPYLGLPSHLGPPTLHQFPVVQVPPSRLAATLAPPESKPKTGFVLMDGFESSDPVGEIVRRAFQRLKDANPGIPTSRHTLEGGALGDAPSRHLAIGLHGVSKDPLVPWSPAEASFSDLAPSFSNILLAAKPQSVSIISCWGKLERILGDDSTNGLTRLALDHGVQLVLAPVWPAFLNEPFLETFYEPILRLPVDAGMQELIRAAMRGLQEFAKTLGDPRYVLGWTLTSGGIG